MNYTPKVRLKTTSIGGVFIMKLTDTNKIQIYALRKHGKTSNDHDNYFIENVQGHLQFPVLNLLVCLKTLLCLTILYYALVEYIRYLRN